jgi:hypothetical protein
MGDIPVEAHCSACADSRFNVAEWNSGEPLHQPNRQHYQDVLQQVFDLHCRTVHGTPQAKS